MYAGWSFYALWLPEWFETVAEANVASGFRGRTWLAVPLRQSPSFLLAHWLRHFILTSPSLLIVWTKHALAINDMTFWSGLFSSGFGVVVGTETPAHGSSAGGTHSASPPLVAAPTTSVLLALVLFGAIVLLQAT